MSLCQRHITESCYDQAGLQANAAECVLSGVKVLGKKSRNRNVYLREAVEGATALYDGVPVYIDHPPKGQHQAQRSLLDRFGKLENPRAVDGELFADLRYNPEHSRAKEILWWAQNAPDCLGLSHNALSLGENRNGEWAVAKIAKVNSVDLVPNPATTKSLYESDMDDLPAADMPVDDAPADAGGWREHLIDGLKKLLGADDIPAEAAKALGRKLLDAVMDDHGDGKDEPADDDSPAEPEPVKESVDEAAQLREENARLKAKERSRKLIGTKLTPAYLTESFVDRLSLLSESDAVAMVDEIRRASSIQKPRSAAPGKAQPAEVDAKTFKNQLYAGVR